MGIDRYKKWKEENSYYISEYGKNWRGNHMEYFKNWRKQNKNKIKEYNNKRKEERREYDKKRRIPMKKLNQNEIDLYNKTVIIFNYFNERRNVENE